MPSMSSSRNKGTTAWTADGWLQAWCRGDSQIRSLLPGYCWIASDSLGLVAVETFTFTMTAPSSRVAVTDGLAMVREGVAWFGAKIAVTVTVKGAVAAMDDAVDYGE